MGSWFIRNEEILVVCFSLPIHDVIYAFKRGVDAQLISQPYRAPVDLLPHPNLRGLWSRSLAIHR